MNFTFCVWTIFEGHDIHKMKNSHLFLFPSFTISYPNISVQLEEPFNILPLRQYSDGVFDGVDFIKSAYSDNDGTG